MFWLSHHYPSEHHRCYQFGGVWVCARCLGTYPVLGVAFVTQVVLHAPLVHPLDLALGTALVAPATLDWAWGRFRPQAFTNAWRSLTGALLGLGLARSLFIHVQRPFPPVLLAQLTLVTALAVPVILVSCWRSTRR
jgi:uncharacterized membrane protein